MKKFLAATALLAVAVPSWGAIIPTFDGVTGTGPFIFSYGVGLAAGTKLDTSQTEEQVVVIYDFDGYTGVSGSSSGNWIISSMLSGPVGVGLQDPNAAFATFPVPPDIPDDPTVPNLIFTYNGPNIPSPDGVARFDTIFAESIFGLTRQDIFRGQGTKVVTGPDPAGENDTAAGTSGFTTVPRPEGDVIIPEPGTYALLGSGLFGMVFLRRRKR
jgi:hypothetical protein